MLEADVSDIVVETTRGTVGVAGVPSTGLDWAALAAAASTANGVIDHSDGTLGLAAQLDFEQGEATFPFGAHIAVVEVDQDTGKVTLLRHIAVDDCGTVLNPLLVEGQQHGGVAAGISQTLYEQVVYDTDGNPLTGNFMDYAFPSAAEFPSFECTAPRLYALTPLPRASARRPSVPRHRRTRVRWAIWGKTSSMRHGWCGEHPDQDGISPDWSEPRICGAGT